MNVVLVEIAQSFESVNILNIMYPNCEFSTFDYLKALKKNYINLYCFFFNEYVCLLQQWVKQKYSNQHTNLPYIWNTYICPNVLPCCVLIFIHCIIRSADDDIIFYVIFSFLKQHTLRGIFGSGEVSNAPQTHG